MITPAEAAAQLTEVRLARVTRPPFTAERPDLTEDWGYAAQDLDRAARIAAGERVIGAKLGLTSRAKQRTMGVHQPVVGFLTDAMAVTEDLLARTCQPRIEPEIAFRLARPISAPLTAAEAYQAIDAVAVAAEIIDSRFAGFGFRLPDVVADNTSAAAFLVGEWRPPIPELSGLSCVLSVDGEPRHTATGAAILGDPILALVHLSEHAGRRGETIEAGALVLAGALTDAVPVVPGATYRAEIDRLGSLEFTTAGQQLR